MGWNWYFESFNVGQTLDVILRYEISKFQKFFISFSIFNESTLHINYSEFQCYTLEWDINKKADVLINLSTKRLFKHKICLVSAQFKLLALKMKIARYPKLQNNRRNERFTKLQSCRNISPLLLTNYSVSLPW